MTGRPAVAALRAQIASKIRAIHHYGNPPDPRLQHDVDGDVEDILEDVQALGAALEAPPEQGPQFQELLAAERALSDAYLRLRRKLAPFGAFDTPRAPTGPQVWATTELALDKALGVRGEAGPTDNDSPNSLQPQLAALRARGGRRVNMAGEAGPLPPSPCQHVDAIERALNELGIPQPGYPQPVANAVEILRASLGVRGVVPASPPESIANEKAPCGCTDTSPCDEHADA